MSKVEKRGSFHATTWQKYGQALGPVTDPLAEKFERQSPLQLSQCYATQRLLRRSDVDASMDSTLYQDLIPIRSVDRVNCVEGDHIWNALEVNRVMRELGEKYMNELSRYIKSYHVPGQWK